MLLCQPIHVQHKDRLAICCKKQFGMAKKALVAHVRCAKLAVFLMFFAILGAAGFVTSSFNVSWFRSIMPAEDDKPTHNLSPTTAG